MIWKLPLEDRLRRWKDFREQLDSMDLEQSLVAVSEFWRSCPFTPYYLDPARPDQWPDPWTLISENYYCDVAKSLGMLYTIALTDHKISTELRIYHNNLGVYNLAWINDGKYVLNMVDGDIVNNTHLEQTDLVLKFKYSGSELKLDNY